MNDIIDENGKNAKEIKINVEENNETFFQKTKNITNKFYSWIFFFIVLIVVLVVVLKKKKMKKMR